VADRKAFLAALGAAGLSLVAEERAQAQTAAPSEPAPAAQPSASAKPAKPPSAAAFAIAATMRRFDPKLTQGELDKIAHAIDDNGKGALALNPKKRPLRNAEEPVTTFVVRGE
jgi:hypothetical protein